MWVNVAPPWSPGFSATLAPGVGAGLLVPNSGCHLQKVDFGGHPVLSGGVKSPLCGE